MPFPCEGNLTCERRLGPGPVFVYEWLTTSRRWQLYALRAAFVCAILAGMIFISRIQQRPIPAGPNVSLQELASYGQTLYLTVISIELTIVLLVAPAATAGAVCLDKMRGTLDHMLATDLSNGEIVLGKLGVRLVPVLGLVACVLPIMALAGLLGGIDPNALFGSFLAAIGCAVLGCSLALTLSVWGRKTHEVLMITYLIIILWLFSPFLLATIFNATAVSVPPVFSPLALGMARIRESLLPCLGSLHEARLGRPDVISGVSGMLPRYFRLFRGSGDLPDSRGGTESGRAILGRNSSASGSRLTGSCSAVAKVAPRPVARRQPGFLARMVPIEAFARHAPGLGGVLGPRVGLDRDHGAKRGLRQHQSRSHRDAECFPGRSRPAALERQCRHQPGRRADARQPRCPSHHPTLDALDPRGEMGRGFPNRSLAAVRAGRDVAVARRRERPLDPVSFFLALLLAYSAMIVSMGLALATWQSRLGRAVASCVAGYVALSIGWPAVVLALLLGVFRSNDRVILPLVLGTPLYGTLFATLGLSGPHRMPGDAADIWVGAVVWVVIHGALAVLLFAATVATFDHSLGGCRNPAWRPRSGSWKKWRPLLDLEFDDEIAPEPPGRPLDPAIGWAEHEVRPSPTADRQPRRRRSCPGGHPGKSRERPDRSPRRGDPRSALRESVPGLSTDRIDVADRAFRNLDPFDRPVLASPARPILFPEIFRVSARRGSRTSLRPAKPAASRR